MKKFLKDAAYVFGIVIVAGVSWGIAMPLVAYCLRWSLEALGMTQ